MHIVCFGDFIQLKPILRKSLADENTGNPNPRAKPIDDGLAFPVVDSARGKKPRLPKEKTSEKAVDTANRTGRQLWLQFKTVIFLEESMRCMADPAYGRLLERLRHGKSTCCCADHLHARRGRAAVKAYNAEAPLECQRDEFCDYHTLCSRVLDGSSDMKQRKWQTARIITHSNPVAAALNREAVAQLAAESREPIFVSLAEDSLPTKLDPLTVREVQKLRKLPDSTTQSRLSALPLTVGMRVILRHNIAIDLGLVNGAEGTIVKIVLDDEEKLPDELKHQRQPGQPAVIRQLRHVPAYVIIRFDDIIMPSQMPGTRSRREAIIVPDQVSYYTPLRRNKRQLVYRHQLPITPTRAMTVQMGQGRTMEPLLADADMTDARGSKHTKLYVMLSRCRTLHGLRLLRHFHHGELHNNRPDHVIVKEMQRLEKMQAITIAAFKRNRPEGFVFAPPIQSRQLLLRGAFLCTDAHDRPVFPGDYKELVEADMDCDSDDEHMDHKHNSDDTPPASQSERLIDALQIQELKTERNTHDQDVVDMTVVAPFRLQAFDPGISAAGAPLNTSCPTTTSNRSCKIFTSTTTSFVLHANSWPNDTLRFSQRRPRPRRRPLCAYTATTICIGSHPRTLPTESSSPTHSKTNCLRKLFRS